MDDNKTRLIQRTPAQNPPPPPPVPTMLDPEKTRIIERPGQGAAPGEALPPPLPPQADNDKTVILGPPRHSRGTDAPQGPAKDAMADPLAGWLVIISGPGQGNFVRLGYGMNSIGRSEDQRCQLDFGDSEISRKNHATVTYDPRGKKFYLMHGGGQNLTYLADAPVLTPTLITGGEHIALGHTVLRFVPFCGPEFDWVQEKT